MNKNLTAKVQIRLPPELRKRVAAEARRLSTKQIQSSVSDVIRALIETHIGLRDSIDEDPAMDRRGGKP